MGPAARESHQREAGAGLATLPQGPTAPPPGIPALSRVVVVPQPHRSNQILTPL
jgi:hypothetical protein